MKTAATLSTDARAWRGLGRFWATILAAVALGAAALAWLGPLEPTATAELTATSGAAADTQAVPGAPPGPVIASREVALPEPPRPEAPAPAPIQTAPTPAPPRVPTAAAVPDQPPIPAVEHAPTRQAAPLPQVVTPAAAPQPAALPAPAVRPAESPAAIRATDTPPPAADPAAPAAAPASGPTPAAAAAEIPAPAAPPAAAPPRTAEGPVVAPLAALPRQAAVAPGAITPPDAGLMEPSRHGPLPRIGPDGRSPARLYARAFDRAQPGPRVALLVGGVGLSTRLAEEAISRLPPEVSLALSPYAPDLAPLLIAARARGIETLMSLPFEPQGWPLNDPGDQAMLTGLPMEQNLDRMFWALSRAQGQIGVVGALGPLRGERFAAQPGALEAVQRILASRGLIYVEPRPGAPLPGFTWGLSVDLVLDEPAGAAAIDSRLAALEARARERGSAVGYAGDPSPVLVARVVAWAVGLARRGVVLAPVSAMIRRPEPR